MRILYLTQYSNIPIVEYINFYIRIIMLELTHIPMFRTIDHTVAFIYI
jgi:hypothetical protein